MNKIFCSHQVRYWPIPALVKQAAKQYMWINGQPTAPELRNARRVPEGVWQF